MDTIPIHRYIEGGHAEFEDGCELSAFSLNARVPIASKLWSKADANSIALVWEPCAYYPISSLKYQVELLAGKTKFFHPTKSTSNALRSAKVIIGFFKPEHALAAIKWLSSKRGLAGSILYTVEITATQRCFGACIATATRMWMRKGDIQMVWGEPRDGLVTLRLTSAWRHHIIEAKRSLESMFAGCIAMKCEEDGPRNVTHELWHAFFGTAAGNVWLQHLDRSNNVNIASDKAQQRLRIYDRRCNIALMEKRLAEQISRLRHADQRVIFQFDTKSFQDLIASSTPSTMKAVLAQDMFHLDIVKKRMIVKCSREEGISLAARFDLPSIVPECPQCGDITTDVELSSCMHVSCRECFDHQLETATADLTRNHFPLLCWHRDCRKPIAITDLRKYASRPILEALFKASVTYHVRSHPDLYRNCRKPDCNSVYPRKGSYEIFMCPTCLTQTCTKCHEEPHVGSTCEEFSAHLEKNRHNEKLLEEYKLKAGVKACPSCGSLIEKTDGCNHIECSGCHCDLCWECMQVFTTPDAAYMHIHHVHSLDVGGFPI